MLRKNWIIIPLILIGFYYNLWTIQNSDKEMIFQEFIYGSLILVFLVFLLLSIFKDLKKYRKERIWLNFIPTIIGMLILFSFIIINLSLKLRDNSPVIIQAGYDGGYNGAWFDFRKDGTYKFVNSGGIGADIFRGKYTIKDSIITLDKSNLEFLKTDKLAIRDIIHGSSSEGKIIYQIDNKHNIIDKDIYFFVNEYHVVE
jgi:hypothetical protein